MMHAMEKPTDLDPGVVLSLTLSARAGTRNVMTIFVDGDVTYQPGFGSSVKHTKLPAPLLSEAEQAEEDDQLSELERRMGEASIPPELEDYLSKHLPTKEFLDLTTTYYKIPSERTCGTAANLYLRTNEKEHWVGVWNYGRGEIPPQVDANMYKGVLKLLDYLTEG